MKAALYCRLSEEDQNKRSKNDDSASIQNQKNMLTQYAIKQGWEIYRIYSDDDYAGADRQRPEFNRLLIDAQEHRFDIVLCKTQSRFTRELELVEKYIHGLFPIWGIRFVSIVDNADTENKGNKKARQINGLINEWYLEDMSENIRSVLKNRRENGLHIGSFALYGYQKDPEKKGHLIIDKQAATVVREVFTLFAEGYGKTAIARILNDREIPNPTEYKRLQGLRYKQANAKLGTLWKYPAISSMLTNEIYIGNMVQGKYGSASYKTKQNKPRPKSDWYIVENTHEPIIERELWDRVQALIKQKQKPFSEGKIGIFAGKLRCEYCGYIMRSSKNREKYYYQCANRHISKNSCEGAFISHEKLEQIILEELHDLLEKYLDRGQLEKNVRLFNNMEMQKKEILSNLMIHQRRNEEYAKGIKALYVDKLKGILSEKDFLELSKDFVQEKERLRNIMANEEKKLSDIEKLIETTDTASIIDEYLTPEHLSRETVDFLIDHISVGKRISGTRNVPIKIFWNF